MLMLTRFLMRWRSCSAAMPDSLYLENLPALSGDDDAPTLVLLHGWASSSQVWRPWLRWLRRDCNVVLVDLPGFGASSYRPAQAWVEYLTPRLPMGAVLVGWSLGGQLAMALAARESARWSGLVCLAANPSFVGNGDWPGMDAGTFSDFQAQFERSQPLTLKQFQALQTQGCEFQRQTLRQLRQLQSNSDVDALRDGLTLLRDWDWRQSLRECMLPVLHVLGEFDALVPVRLKDELPAQQSHCVINGAAHLPFLSHPETTWQHLRAYLQLQGLLRPAHRGPRRDKLAVAASFSKAAITYDGAAELQRAVCDRLLSMSAHSAGRILDLGCGTGAAIPSLTATKAEVIGLDLAEGMLHCAAGRHGSDTYWVCGDAENLPLADASVDAVFSSLSIQWCEALQSLFSELWRVLKPGGSCALATLGPNTLHELRQSWAKVDGLAHVNDFPERAALTAAFSQAGFELSDWQEELRLLHYPDVISLSRELKALGAHNLNTGRPAGLQGRRRFQAWQAAYESQRSSEGLPASYQVWYLCLRKAHG